MKKIALLLISSFLLLTACNGAKENSDELSSDASVSSQESSSASSSSVSEEMEEMEDITVAAKMQGKENDYKETYTYNNSYFLTPSNEFNKDIAMFAFGAATANTDRKSMYNFYTALGFSNIFISNSYLGDPTETSIAYTFATRSNVLIASIRGFNYQAEWSNNFLLGKEGDHEGFTLVTNKFIKDLDKYINKYSLFNHRILITGYSRAGAVANMAADMLFKREADQKLVPDENFYIYTYEAPMGLANKTAYGNVFNLVNSGDPIPYFAPAKYGFTRCGNDIDIYASNIDELAAHYHKGITLPAFTPQTKDEGDSDLDPDYANEAEYAQYVMKLLLREEVDVYPMDTREHFVDNGQPIFQYFLKMVFSLKSATLTAIGAALATKSTSDLLSLIVDGQNLHDFLKPYLTLDGYQFDDDELLENCNIVSNMITAGPLSAVLLLYMLGQDNLNRAIYMHYPEINYILLKNYLSQAE